MKTLDSLLATWDGLGVVSRHDTETGAWIFIALHNDTLGPSVGGTRMKHYASPPEALRDAMRLAQGMTEKWAALGFDSGGGKAVLAVPGTLAPEQREGLLRRYGRLLETLHGTFSTGRDLGTTDDDMRILAEVTRYVHGVDRITGETRDPGPYTAAGVFEAMRTALVHLFERDDWEGRSVLVQGLGDVGAPLAHKLSAAGARLLLSDLDRSRAEKLGEELHAGIVSAEAVYDETCDIFAPCAVGGVLDGATIPRLGCRAVVGSANNQLGRSEDADRLHQRRILYAPDFVANAGGALAFGLIHRGVKSETEIATRIKGIGTSLGEILTEAGRHDESPLWAARRRVQRVLSVRAASG